MFRLIAVAAMICCVLQFVRPIEDTSEALKFPLFSLISGEPHIAETLRDTVGRIRESFSPNLTARNTRSTYYDSPRYQAVGTAPRRANPSAIFEEF